MKVLINDGWTGALYEDGALTKLLPPGKHEFPAWPWSPERSVAKLDLRERSTTIKNQEILTADKVSVRLSLLVYFKLIDPKAALTEVTDFEARIYEDVQLAARRFLATQTLDQILRDRNELSDAIKQDVSTSAKTYGVEIRRADVKDLVFPGNLREIMNRVIETERASEAKLIDARARAEVAQLEARAQIAALEERIRADEKQVKLLADNPLLVRVKELEVLRDIGLKGNNKFYIGLGSLQRDED
ncbi:MAG: slipin family protein [Myxococcota bacterium]